MNTQTHRRVEGQFLNTNDMNLGSISILGFNCVDISLKAFQTLVNTKTNQIGLKIYYSTLSCNFSFDE